MNFTVDGSYTAVYFETMLCGDFSLWLARRSELAIGHFSLCIIEPGWKSLQVSVCKNVKDTDFLIRKPVGKTP